MTNQSIELIRAAISMARRPAVMCSFGKDSMVLAHLIRETIGAAGAFPIDVIYHRDPWFPHKNEFADHVIASWSMSVHDWAPMRAGVKVKPDMLELVSRYTFGMREIDIPKNVCRPEDYPRRDFLCGLQDWINRPKSFLMDYPWDVVFHGHKSCDVDPFMGAVPLKHDEVKVSNVRVIFPLRHWSDEDIWDYIESEHVPVQGTRYQGRKEVADKWHNNDYTHACTACIDPRVSYETVWCPKLKREVPNYGGQVLQLQGRPSYIESEAA